MSSAAQAPPTIGSELYTGVATFGRIRAVIGAIVGSIIALILIVMGVSRLRDPHTATAMMVITAAACNPVAPPPGSANKGPAGYVCDVTVAFTAADGQKYASPHVKVVSPTPLAVGRTIALRYDPADPTSVVQEAGPRSLGWALIGGGLLVGGGMTALAVLSFKSKGFAAFEGTAGLVGMVSR